MLPRSDADAAGTGPQILSVLADSMGAAQACAPGAGVNR